MPLCNCHTPPACSSRVVVSYAAPWKNSDLLRDVPRLGYGDFHEIDLSIVAYFRGVETGAIPMSCAQKTSS